MNLASVIVGIGLLGVEVGWQPYGDDGVEYLIQIEPHLLDSMKAGQVIRSDVPESVTNIRAYQISVGNRELPRTLPTKTAGSQWRSQRLPAHLDTDAGRSESRAGGGEHGAGSAASGRHPGEAATTGPRPLDAARESAGSREGDSATPSKPWWALTWSLLALFASLGANVYLGWMFWDVHRRYQSLVRATPGTSEAGG